MTKWTKREISIVVEHYHAKGADWCSRATGRTASSVYQLADRLGLMKRHNFLTESQIIKAIKLLHPKGYSDSEVKTWLEKKHKKGTDRHRIGRIRRSLGLLPNTLSKRRRSLVAKRTKAQLEAAGLESLSSLRINQWNKWKRSLGWPEELTVRAVQSLEAFWQLGPGVPVTRLQLCRLIGYRPRKRTDPPSNAKGGTVMAELTRAGFIAASRRGVPGKVSGKRDHRGKPVPVTFYYLKHGVKPDGNRIKQTSSTTKAQRNAS